VLGLTLGKSAEQIPRNLPVFLLRTASEIENVSYVLLLVNA